MTGKTTWAELVSQPDAWDALLARLDAGEGIPEVDVAEYDEILLLGSGTSYYLALAAADWIARRHALPVRAAPSCEVILDPHQAALVPGRRRLAIAISRSGESSELILALDTLKDAGTTVFGVGCVVTSTLMRQADLVHHVQEGQEDGLVMLRSFTSMLLALQHLFGTPADRAALRALPAAARAILDHDGDELKKLARLRPFDRFVYLASGPSYPIALEAGLKVQEMSISTAEAYHSLEYRHGPKATADRNTFLTIFALSDLGRGLALARDMKALGVTLLVVGPGADQYGGIADMVIPAPLDMDEGHASVTSLLPLQILAFETAMRKGKNPDAPENLSKVVILEKVTG
jgi:glucosamine--fructose-6-phosphate aminotransferase (isomerizing)